MSGLPGEPAAPPSPNMHSISNVILAMMSMTTPMTAVSSKATPEELAATAVTLPVEIVGVNNVSVVVLFNVAAKMEGNAKIEMISESVWVLGALVVLEVAEIAEVTEYLPVSEDV